MGAAHAKVSYSRWVRLRRVEGTYTHRCDTAADMGRLRRCRMKRVRVSMSGVWVAITHAGLGEGAQMGPIGKVPNVQAVPRLRTRQQSTVRRVEAGGCIAEGGDKSAWGVSFAGCRELAWPALTHTSRVL